MAVKFSSDLDLARQVIGGDARAVSRYLDIAATSVWPAVIALCGDGAAAESAFLGVIDALKANGFARLRRYEGDVRLSRFLILAARDVAAEQVARAIGDAPREAWGRFDRLFRRDIRRLIERRFPRADPSRQDDLLQEISARLIENDFARVRAYRGHGAFVGFVLTVVNRLLIDLQRQEAPRRRLPAEIERASPLNRALFIEVVWRGQPVDADRLLPAVQTVRPPPPPTRAEVVLALDELAHAIAAAQAASARPREVSIDGADGAPIPQLPAADGTPETGLIDVERERAWNSLAIAIRREAPSLPPEERLYLDVILSASDGLPPREIARQMGVPADEVGRLQQRVQRWATKLYASLRESAAVSV